MLKLKITLILLSALVSGCTASQHTAISPEPITSTPLQKTQMLANTDSELDSELEAEFYKQFGAVLPKLTTEQNQLALNIYSRLYNLYPAAYYQHMLDKTNMQVLMMYQVLTADPNESSTDSDKAAVECVVDMNQLNRYKEYIRRAAFNYVNITPLAEVRDTITMLNYPFIDELALETQKGNDITLSTDFFANLKQNDNYAHYQDFYTSPQYDFIKDMVIMDSEDKGPMPTFLYANSMYCVYKFAPPKPVLPQLHSPQLIP